MLSQWEELGLSKERFDGWGLTTAGPIQLFVLLCFKPEC